MSNIQETKIDVEKLPICEKKQYYENLRSKCILLKNSQLSFGQDLIKRVYPLIRNYKIEIQGEENIPMDSNVLFVANHSNSHDIFTAYEIFSMLQRRGSVMVATDCLNPITTQLFNFSNATLLDRNSRNERNDSILLLSKKIMEGKDGLIFGEGTWNIHPILQMHNIKNGAAKISIIAEVPIVPVIFEYIEKNEMVSLESELYDKCIIRFGRPIMINNSDLLSSQSNGIKENMSAIRRQIWNDYNIIKGNIRDIDPIMYVNHTYAKKFKSFGFTYDSRLEQEFLLFLDNEPKENEYTINEYGEFVPGITEKKLELRKLLK